ncbi:hypothetical protein D5086_016679 [Populus alba]|uniref:Uncharacterized protein n=1 Tax=Populus alba TaxID=43335 RepID=A0ACC4BV84_POPAL
MCLHDEELFDNQDKTGWKFIHGDVFQYPYYKSLFAAAVGSGTQLFTLTILLLILGMAGAFHPYKQGYLFISLVVIYALTSALAGYTSAYYYVQLEGTEWMALAGFLPFNVILNELDDIFASAWGHNIYSIYGFLFLLCTLLLITTALVTVALTYFQLVLTTIDGGGGTQIPFALPF